MLPRVINGEFTADITMNHFMKSRLTTRRLPSNLQTPRQVNKGLSRELVSKTGVLEQ